MKNYQLNLISDIDQRNSRKQEKQYAVLRFLRQHLWSSQNILQVVMKLQSRQAAYKTLTQIQMLGFIRSYQYSALGGKLTLWGITSHGQLMAFDPACEEPCSVYFEPSRVSEQNIRHQLDLQKLRVTAEAHGWLHWVDGDRLGSLDKNAKRPDAIANDANGLVVAVECERTFKTVKRYEQILVSYLKLLKSGQIAKVVWVAPNKDMAERLRKVITGIKTVRVAGQKVQIDPERHHTNLVFSYYATWPRF